MQREIKFRVWDVDGKKFIDPQHYDIGQVLLDFAGNIRIAAWSQGNGDNAADSVYSPVGNQSNYTIQQYTGLKDKNNKEIYEGDILVYSENDPTSTADRTLVRVEYKGSGFCYRDLATNKLDSIHSIIGIVEVDVDAEIIGNIFENVYLLP